MTSSSTRKSAGEQEAVDRQQAVQVEVHAGHDEVHGTRNPNPIPSRRIRTILPVRRVEHEPDDEPGGERPEHELEARVRRDEARAARGRRSTRARRPARSCAACPGRPQEPRGARRIAIRAARRRARRSDEEHDLGDGAVDAREEDRDEDDRPELAGDPRAEHGAPELGRQQPRVRQDRDERRRARSSRARRRGATTPRRRPPVERDIRARAPIAREIPQPTVPAGARRGTWCSTTSRPAKKNRSASAEVREERDERVDFVAIRAPRPDEDPEHDLDDDGRQQTSRSASARARRRASTRGNEDERARLLLRDLRRERSHERVARGTPARALRRRLGEGRLHRLASLPARRASCVRPRRGTRRAARPLRSFFGKKKKTSAIADQDRDDRRPRTPNCRRRGTTTAPPP